MAIEVLKRFEKFPISQLLYIVNNCNQEIIEQLLDADIKPDDMPTYKFKRLPKGTPKFGVSLNGTKHGFTYDGLMENTTEPREQAIAVYNIYCDNLDDYEDICAVYSLDGFDLEVCRVTGSTGQQFFTIRHSTNFLTPSFTFYGKRKNDGAFVLLSTTNDRYADPTIPVAARTRWFDPIEPWGNWDNYNVVQDSCMMYIFGEKQTGGCIEHNDASTYINFRIAKDIYSAKKYLIDGDESGLIDEGNEPEKKPLYEKLYFKQEYWYGVIDSTTDPNSHYVDGYYDSNYHFNSADMDADFYAKYQFNLRDKPNLCMYIGTPSTPVSTHAPEFFNARPHLYFLERSGVVYTDEEFPIFLSNMGVSHRYKSMNNIAGMTPIGLAPRYNTSLGEIHGIPDNILYGANLETNIPIFRTRELAEKYLAGEIGKDQAINQVGPNIEQGNLTGHQLISHTYNNVNADAVCSECLCCNSGAFQEFFDKLFDTTNREDILAGLELYGTDVASFIVDTFVVPFDYSVFQDTIPTNRLTFGSYSQTFDSSFNKTTKLNPKIVPAFSCSIVGGFNDWRDWQSEYYLSLPYVGKNIHINKEVYLYHLLECDVSVDLRTGQIKYFIKCDGVVTDTYEGVCRISMPIQTTNNYSYAREKLDACASVLGGSVGAVMNAASGNPTGIIGNVTGVVDGLLDLDKVNPINTTGNCSPSNAWNDPLECYLIVQTPEFEYSQNIPNTYGYPANYVGNIGNQSGYIECRSVFLKSSATETEQNEILQLLANGIII